MVEKFLRTAYYDIGKAGQHMYVLPHPLLRPYIAHYTAIFAGGEQQTDTLTLIPDASGCMIFTVQDGAVRATAYGPMTKTAVVKNDIGTCPMRLFVEFLPGGMAHFVREQQEALADTRPELDVLNRRVSCGVVQAMERERDFRGFIQAVDQILLSELERSRAVPAPLTMALAEIGRTHGTAPVKRLSETSFYSARHLNRLFNTYIGMNAKTFSRLVRINYAVSLLKTGNSSLTALAQQAGFFDQAHFIREFETVCGAAPSKYRDNLSEFYNEPLKF